MAEDELKTRTARSVKWNVIDRVGTQVLYAVTGVILARELSQEAFGLIGALLIFQGFAMLFIDSGFSYALIQRKRPTETDYSSVFWFNMLVAVAIYVILWFCAPLIAGCFGSDERLIPLSRVMFLTFIINASAIVQTNRLMKQMNVRPVALTNFLGLAAGAVVGIWMAYAGYGPWAIVWQSIAINLVKSVALWIYCRWVPAMCLSVASLRSFFKVGGGMMMTSFLNVLFQNIYSFFIGNRVGLVPLGYYTQSDKWSKMGVTAVSQVLTSSFLPALSEVQDEGERFRRVVSKMNRFTSWLLFPSMLFLIVMATPLFHVLFGEKWDPSIILFRLLLVRGIFTVFCSLYNNFMLALGHSGTIFRLELFRDVIAIAGILVTLPYIALSSVGNVVEGLTIFLWGQVIASALTWVVTLAMTIRLTGVKTTSFLRDMAPYLTFSAMISPTMVLVGDLAAGAGDVAVLALQGCTGLGLYLAVNAISGSKVQRDAIAFIFKK